MKSPTIAVGDFLMAKKVNPRDYKQRTHNLEKWVQSGEYTSADFTYIINNPKGRTNNMMEFILSNSGRVGIVPLINKVLKIKDIKNIICESMGRRWRDVFWSLYRLGGYTSFVGDYCCPVELYMPIVPILISIQNILNSADNSKVFWGATGSIRDYTQKILLILLKTDPVFFTAANNKSTRRGIFISENWGIFGIDVGGRTRKIEYVRDELSEEAYWFALTHGTFTPYQYENTDVLKTGIPTKHVHADHKGNICGREIIRKQLIQAIL